MPKLIHIDLDKIHNTAIRGISRAAVFLGLGVNAANNQDLDEYHLVKDTNFKILPETVPDDILTNWKNEYKIWTVGCGFRELVDRYCVYLDRIYHACSIFNQSSTPETQSKFEFYGLDRKLETLEREFSVKCNSTEQLSSFTRIRNCYVHRLGRVGKKDIERCDPFTIRFKRFDSLFIEDGGNESTIPDLFDPNSPDYTTPAAGTLALKWIEKELEFKLGDWILLTPKDLTEILFLSQRCASEITLSAIDFAKSKGINIENQAEQGASHNERKRSS